MVKELEVLGVFWGFGSFGRLFFEGIWAALWFLFNIHAAIKAPDLGVAARSKHPKTHWTGTNLGVCFPTKVSGLLKAEKILCRWLGQTGALTAQWGEESQGAFYCCISCCT